MGRTAGDKIERKYLAHFIDAGFGNTGAALFRACAVHGSFWRNHGGDALSCGSDDVR